jgi:hypothetical protein
VDSGGGVDRHVSAMIGSRKGCGGAEREVSEILPSYDFRLHSEGRSGNAETITHRDGYCLHGAPARAFTRVG